MPNGRVRASCTDPRKCYENTFDGSKSRVTKVDEDGWKKRAERRLRREKEGRKGREKEREGEKETLLARNVYACRT